MNKRTINTIIISINTSDHKKVVVSLIVNGKVDTLERFADQRKAQAVLPMIDTLLRRNNVDLKDITSVRVHNGPGSFTGLRVGIAIANTLGYLLQIPVNDNRVGQQVDAVYS